MDKMLIKPMALAASVLASAFLFGMQTASAQNDKPAATATRPAKTPSEQTHPFPTTPRRPRQRKPPALRRAMKPSSR